MKKIKKLLKILGPGFITGASDDDPSGIATYSQTGASFGYSQLWTALFSFPFMTVVQEMCGRIGAVSGKGLSGVIKHNYSKKILYISISLLFLANMINIGTDLGAMASALQLVVGVPFILLLVIITALTLILEIFVSYKVYSKYLRYLTFSLFAYIAVAAFVKGDWIKIFASTVIPTISFNKDYIFNIAAILGTTISPYLFFWQANEEVEEEVKEGKIRMMGAGVPRVTKKDIRLLRLDTVIGMFFSNLIMFFIILTCAATLNKNGIFNIETASDAALALEPLAGNFASTLFALGIVGTGLLAVPVLAGSASYAVSEAFGWREGLYRKLSQAWGFYGIIIVATLIGLLINFTSIPPFKMLYYAAILNGIVAPPLLFMIMIISNNKKIMGGYTNSTFTNIFGWIITAIMSIVGIVIIASLFL